MHFTKSISAIYYVRYDQNDFLPACSAYLLSPIGLIAFTWDMPLNEYLFSLVISILSSPQYLYS